MNSSPNSCEVSDLTIELFDEAIAGHRAIVSDVSFSLAAGHGLGITGESGSGKTTLSLALSGLLPQGSHLAAKSFRLSVQAKGNPAKEQGHVNLVSSASEVSRLSGRGIFTLFQEPRSSLNPYRTIGWQLNRCLESSQVQISNLKSQIPDLKSFTQGVSASPQLAALASVGLEHDVLRCYPHELSTGMCQRVFLAMASLMGSRILVADEPFASVDWETQKRLSSLVREWMQNRGISLILVSHDLDLLRELTDQVLVMFRGQVAERGPTRQVLGADKPVHPYTRLLCQVGQPAASSSAFLQDLGSGTADVQCCFAPRCAWGEPGTCTELVPTWREGGSSKDSFSSDAELVHRLRCVRHPINWANSAEQKTVTPTRIARESQEQCLRVIGLNKRFSTGWFQRSTKRVLDDVNFTVLDGERLGIMGPSGQGKTTLARLILGVLSPSAGKVQVRIGDRWMDVAGLRSADRVKFRRQVQMVYQDTDLVLDPAARVGEALVEAYQVFEPRLSRTEAYRLAARLLEELALSDSMLEAYPFRLSGGERKRIALARALAAFGCPFEAQLEAPSRLLVLDEPTAGVDVVLQAIVTRFLIWAQRRLRLSYLVISHDEVFVRSFCDRAIRLSGGKIVTETDHVQTTTD